MSLPAPGRRSPGKHSTDEHSTDEHSTDERSTDEHGTDEHGTDERSAHERGGGAGPEIGDGAGERAADGPTIRSYPLQNALSGFVPIEVDTTRPHPARMHDYLLGGSDNYRVDRDAVEQVAALMPRTLQAAHELRNFTHRAVRFMAGEGIRQFLDVGCGVPTSPNVHEIAGEIMSGVRVAYVDNDPIVRVHAQARLPRTGDQVFIPADLREPQGILESAALRALLDFGRPIGLLLSAVIYYLSDEDEPGRAIATLRDALPPGSFVAVSHVSFDLAPQEELASLAAIAPLTNRSATPMKVRTEPEIRAYFDGFELVEPGLVQISQWRPDLASAVEGVPQGTGIYAFAAVGRKM
jgi:hypothetical protein